MVISFDRFGTYEEQILDENLPGSIVIACSLTWSASSSRPNESNGSIWLMQYQMLDGSSCAARS